MPCGDWVVLHMAGNPAFDLPVDDQVLLIPELMAMSDDAGRVTVVDLVALADDDELLALMGGPGCRRMSNVPWQDGSISDVSYPAREFTPGLAERDAG